MIFLVILGAITIVFLLARIYLTQKSLKQINLQLKSYNLSRTNQKLNVPLTDKPIEELAVEINKLIDLRVQENINKRRTELELKQAIANISHDLRTPLTSILGYIQLLESDETPLNDKQSYLDIAKKRTKQLQKLLNEFFELSIIESSDYELKLEPIKFNHLLSEILITYYDAFMEAHLKPEFQLTEDEAVILADSTAVTRVLDNLIVNTINHAASHVSIQLKVSSDMVILTISNDIHPLNEIDVQLIFDRFYTADKARHSKGTGLGLTIAKNLMLKMNGQLSAELKDNRLNMTTIWPRL